MEDQLITFETAKLAKEKGFTLNIIGSHIFNYYEDSGTLGHISWGHLHLNNPAAVPQSILHRWIREQHKIEIDVTFSTITGTYKTTLWVKSDITNGDHYVPKKRIGHIQTYNTYEQALEIGLEKALKLI